VKKKHFSIAHVVLRIGCMGLDDYHAGFIGRKRALVAGSKDMFYSVAAGYQLNGNSVCYVCVTRGLLVPVSLGHFIII